LPPSFEEKVLSVLTHPRRARRTYDGAQDFSAAFFLSLQLPLVYGTARPPHRQRSFFHWVRDGVVVQTTSLPVETSGLVLSVYANAEGLKTDLTGFQLVDEERKLLREEEILKKMSEVCQSLASDLPDFFREDVDQHAPEDKVWDEDQDYRSRVKVLLKGSGAGLFLTLVNPPIGVVATFGGVASAYVPRAFRKPPDHILAHRKILEEIIVADLGVLGRELPELGVPEESHQAVSEIDVDFSALELDPRNESQVTGLFDFFAGEEMKLVTLLNKRIASQPSEPYWLLLLARAYRKADMNTRATRYYEQFLNVVPVAEVYRELAGTYSAIGKDEMAIRARDRALALNPVSSS
jgi:tetratricopeptide (TPR) repeat protein